MIHAHEQAFLGIAHGQPLAQFPGQVIQHRAVGRHVDFRILGLRHEQRALFQFNRIFVLQTERHEPRIRNFPVEVTHDFLRVPAQSGVAADLTGFEPELRVTAEGNDLLLNRLIHGWIIIPQQLDQGVALRARQLILLGPSAR